MIPLNRSSPKKTEQCLAWEFMEVISSKCRKGVTTGIMAATRERRATQWIPSKYKPWDTTHHYARNNRQIISRSWSILKNHSLNQGQQQERPQWHLMPLGWKDINSLDLQGLEVLRKNPIKRQHKETSLISIFGQPSVYHWKSPEHKYLLISNFLWGLSFLKFMKSLTPSVEHTNGSQWKPHKLFFWTYQGEKMIAS